MITEVLFALDVRVGQISVCDTSDEVCVLPGLRNISNAPHVNFSLNPELAVVNANLADACRREKPRVALDGEFWRMGEKWYIRDQGRAFEVYSDGGWMPDTLRVRDPNCPLAQGIPVRFQDGRWKRWEIGLLGGGKRKQLTPEQQAAKERNKIKEMAWRQETEESEAVRRGFFLREEDGKPVLGSDGKPVPDTQAFKRRKVVSCALANDCVKRDDEGNAIVGPGNRPVADINAYRQLAKEKSAINHMFVLLAEDGSPILDANGMMIANKSEYERYLEKNKAIGSGFFKKDEKGRPILDSRGQKIADLRPYWRQIERHSAINASYFKKDSEGKPILDAGGSKIADLTAYHARRKHKAESTS